MLPQLPIQVRHGRQYAGLGQRRAPGSHRCGSRGAGGSAAPDRASRRQASDRRNRATLAVQTAARQADSSALTAALDPACRYSPNLSQRCTHLAVPRAALKPRGTCSHKLQSAVRHERQWALHIVDLTWLHQCDIAQRRLEEAPFRPPAELLAALAPAPRQEQAPPNARTAAVAPSGSGTVLAAETRPHPSWQPARSTAARIAGGAARGQPYDTTRQSINSRPLSSFGAAQLPASLQTQAPSVQNSMQRTTGWAAICGAASAAEEPQHVATPKACAWGGAAAAAPPPPQAGQLPDAVRGSVASSPAQSGGKLDFSRLPMTQAGFMPAADLMARLFATSHAALPGRAAPASADAAAPQLATPLALAQQCFRQECSGQVHAAEIAARPAAQSCGREQQQTAPAEGQQRRAGGPPGLAAAEEDGTGAAAVNPLQPEGRLSSADLVQQLQLAAAGLDMCTRRDSDAQHRWQHAVQGSPALPQGLQLAPCENSGTAQQDANTTQWAPGLPIADLLDRLRALGGCAADAGGQQDSREAQQAGEGHAGLEELLRRLRACGPAAAAAPAQQQQGQERGLESPPAGQSSRPQQRTSAGCDMQPGSPPAGGGVCSFLTQQVTASHATSLLLLTQTNRLPGQQPWQRSGTVVHRDQTCCSADGIVPLPQGRQDSCTHQPQMSTATPHVQPSCVAAAPCTPTPDWGAATTHLADQLRQLAQQSTFTPLPGRISCCVPTEQLGGEAAQHTALERGAPGRAVHADAAPVACSTAPLQLPAAASRAPDSIAGGGAGSKGGSMLAEFGVCDGADLAPAASPASSAASPAGHAAASRQACPPCSSSMGEAPQPAPAASSQASSSGSPTTLHGSAAQVPLRPHLPTFLQVSGSGSRGGGVFAGMLAILDPALPAEEQRR